MMIKIKTLLFVFFVTTAFAFGSNPVWQSFYAGNGDNTDRYNSVVSDGNGNFVGVGYTMRSGNYRDFLVVKFDANGDTIWTRTKNGKGNGEDEAVAAVVDASGNVFVCGSSEGEISNTDILLIKYDANGNKLFDTTWNSVNYYDDNAVAMVLDPNGDIIIGGNTEPDTVSGSENYITLKYAPDGTLRWSSEFTGSGSAKDELAGVAVDANGDIYVTGRTMGSTDDNYSTIKYSGIDGSQLWNQIYNSGNGNDRATAIVIDNSGAVIVTGRSKGSSNDDFRTIKYSAAGVLQWTKSYNAPANQDDRAIAIGVDASDNVYVTGQSDADNTSSINYDFAIVKYNSSGTQQWAKIIGSVFMQDDIPAALKVDGAGNVYVTGKSDQDPGTSEDNDWMTVMYNSAGTLVWNMTKGGSSLGKGDTPGSLIVDGSNNLYVVGSIDNTTTQKDASVVKYDASGTELFAKGFNGTGDFSEHAKEIVIDSNDISYSCGYSFRQDQNRDASIIQTDNGGTITCTYFYNGAKNDDDEFNDIALSSNGSIYAVGFTKVSGQKSNFLIVKYNTASCDTIWTRTYDYIGQSDKAEEVTIDAAGNIYVTGRSNASIIDSIENNDIVTMKFDANGNQQWIQRYNGSGNLKDEPAKIIIDNAGDILVCGRTENVHDDDFIVLKYNANNGAPVWATPIIYGGPFANDDRAIDLTVDASNNIYVCGYTQTASAPANEDPTILKYDNAGNQIGFYSYNADGQDQPVDIAHDLSGNIYVAIRTDGDGDGNPETSNYNFLTMKFDSDLLPVWATAPTYDSPINQDDVPVDMTITPAGDVLVTGTTENDSTGGRINQNWLTIMYDTNGNVIDLCNYDGPNGTDDAPNSVAIRGGSFWVCGYTEGTGAQKDNAVLKYILGVGIDEVGESVLSSVYPNPVTGSATIELLNPTENNHLLIITDIAGAIVSEKSFSGSKVQFSKNDLASGMYQYRISDKSSVISRGKFIIN